MMRRRRKLVLTILAALCATTVSAAPANAFGEVPVCEPPRLSFGAAEPAVTLDLYFDPSASRAAALPRAARALTATRMGWLSIRLKPLRQAAHGDLSRRIVTDALVAVAAQGRVEAALQWAEGLPHALLAARLKNVEVRRSIAQTLGVDSDVLDPASEPTRCASELLSANAHELRVDLEERPAEPRGAAGLLPFAVVRGNGRIVTLTSVDQELARLGTILDDSRQRLRREHTTPAPEPRSAASTRDAARLGTAPPSLELTSPHARHHMEVVVTGERFDESIERVRFALQVRAQALGDVTLTIDAWGSTGAADLLRTRSCQAAAADRVLDYIRYLATPTVKRGEPHLRALIDGLDRREVTPAECPSQQRALTPPPGLRINGVVIPPGDAEAARDALRRTLFVDYLVALP